MAVFFDCFFATKIIIISIQKQKIFVLNEFFPFKSKKVSLFATFQDLLFLHRKTSPP